MLKSLNRQTAHVQPPYPERIVQFGGGNFLRGFVDWVIEELNRQTDFASGVVVVKPTSQGSYSPLEQQEGLFHVRLHDFRNGELKTETQLITCVNRVINPHVDFDAYLALARQPDIRFIVSNTTELGIAFAPEDTLEDTPPSSFPAKLAIFLYHRYQHFGGDTERGCVILPCELIEQNGDILKEIILKYANQWGLEAAFGEWIQNSNLFCNTLVDRIVPGPPRENKEAILETLGYDDQLLLEAERYHLWAIEGPEWLREEFPVHRTNMNVRVVQDVTPYRLLKIRILNGSHTAMLTPAYFLGLTTVKEAVDHPFLGGFIQKLVYEEIVPVLNMPEQETIPFAQAVLDRFGNPFIHHQLVSIALNSISKFKARLLPTLIAYQQQNQKLPQRVIFAFASLIRFYKGTWDGKPTPLNDDAAVMAWFQQQWETCPSHEALVTAVLTNETLWGQDISTIPGLSEQVSEYLTLIDQDLTTIIEKLSG